jgi:hypothetical protein
MTYSDLVARLEAFLGDDETTDSDWLAALPGIIEQAELRCYRDVDFLAARKIAVVTLPANLATFLTPADWVIGHSIRLPATNATLDRREQSFLADYGTGTGTPRYWCEMTAGVVLLAPIPNLNTAAELTYHARAAGLSSANATTWLATNLPDLLFYAAMVAATGYRKNFGAQADDPKMALSWEQQYQRALQAVLREEGRRKGENSFDSSVPAAPPSNLPQ